MENKVRIQMMGNFLIYINEQRVENPVTKSRKGVALMMFLILNQGKPVANQRLLRTLWEDHRVTNPENALKTLVSRVRAMLNQRCLPAWAAASCRTAGPTTGNSWRTCAWICWRS